MKLVLLVLIGKVNVFSELILLLINGVNAPSQC
jgi:hypothetical protein